MKIKKYFAGQTVGDLPVGTVFIGSEGAEYIRIMTCSYINDLIESLRTRGVDYIPCVCVDNYELHLIPSNKEITSIIGTAKAGK